MNLAGCARVARKSSPAIILTLAALTTAACNPSASSASKASSGPTASEPVAPGRAAAIGQPAPDFSLRDLDGTAYSLAQFRGKTVVLEWFNPGCPFVRLSHEKGSLKGLATKATADGVVWMAINSAAPRKQGAEPAENGRRKAEWSMRHPILLDPTGEVGHRYGATNTPHMYVIDPGGTLVYKGAIDNSPDGEGQSPQGSDRVVNYVTAALADLAAHRPVGVAETRAYGCSVKYANP